MVAVRRQASAGLGHNAGPSQEDRNTTLTKLEQDAVHRQKMAQKAWAKLLVAQLDYEQPWMKILRSATNSGIAPDIIRMTFRVNPSTWSRWQSGGASPSQAHRSRLSDDLKALANQYANVVKDES